MGFTAEALTALGLLVAAGAGGLFAAGHLRWGALLVLLAGLLDSADGTVARLRGTVSPAGAFMDSAVDRYCEAIIFCGLWYIISRSRTAAWRCSRSWPYRRVLRVTRGPGWKASAGVPGRFTEREDRAPRPGGFFGELGVQVSLWVLVVFFALHGHSADAPYVLKE
jgi:hypothetical protein